MRLHSFSSILSILSSITITSLFKGFLAGTLQNPKTSPELLLSEDSLVSWLYSKLLAYSKYFLSALIGISHSFLYNSPGDVKVTTLLLSIANKVFLFCKKVATLELVG